MNCVIIDDEPMAIRLIGRHIKKTEGLHLLKSFENAFEALYFIQTKPVDLVFLDIQMPGINGLQFVKILKYPPRIIITTAYKEYALDAMEIGVIDYLLKPVSYDRFLNGVSKAFEGHFKPNNPPEIYGQPERSSFFFVKGDGGYVRINSNEVLFFQGDRNYCRLHTTDRQYCLSGNLSYYQMKLPGNKFLRVHKSYIIALDKVQQYNPESVWVGDHELPIGKTYKLALMNYLNEYRL